MTRKDLREAMEAAGVRPRRQLGQNFLADEGTARWIVSQLGAGADDCVIEAGPGFGALSDHLAGRVRRLVLVELDARLAAWLRSRFVGVPGVEVVSADAARLDLRPFLKEAPVKFLGNLPYSAGGAILANFFQRASPVARGVLMLQKEFVDRMTAAPRHKDYGVLSLRMQAEWKLTRLRDIGPEVFVPRPRIDSTVVLVEPLPAGARPAFDARLFDELVRRGFGQRRKQVYKQLPVPVGDWPQLAAKLGIEQTARAEELSVEDWIALARLLDPQPLGLAPQSQDEWFDVVDEANQVVGRERRGVVHARRLLHRAVHVFVFNRKGELFLQKRSHLKDSNPGTWNSSAAGHLDSGEDYAVCAVRELAEELGITDAVPEEIARVEPSAATGWEHVRLFRASWDGPVCFPCGEIETGIWIAPAELDIWIVRRPQDFAPGFLECLRACHGIRISL